MNWMSPEFEVLKILEALCLLPFMYVVNQFLFKKLEEKHDFFSSKPMNLLFIYHLVFAGIYYTYAIFNPSDSKRYFRVVNNTDEPWFHFFQTETSFIDFLSYPLIRYFSFSYEMMMLSFAWLGFLGFVFAYLLFKEHISLKIKIFKKIDFLWLILFLPNMHFWTASLGKGAPIFLGLMLFAYSLRTPGKRWKTLVTGTMLIFAIRPHMLLLIIMGSMAGIMFCKQSMDWKRKSLLIASIGSILLIFHQPILKVVDLHNSSNLVSDFLSFSEQRAESLSDSGSGVNMTEYSLPEKFFTFWFRPLFFDAPGFFGIIVSIENLIYLLIFGKILRLKFFRFLKSAPVHVKSSLALFLFSSFAMTFIMSNLGIIIRQKTMIMYFLFFVIYYYLGQEKNISRKSEGTANLHSLSKAT